MEHDSSHSYGQPGISSQALHMPLWLVGLPSTMVQAHAPTKLGVYFHPWEWVIAAIVVVSQQFLKQGWISAMLSPAHRHPL